MNHIIALDGISKSFRVAERGTGFSVRFFTYIIPFGCINCLPLMYILDKSLDGPSWLYAFLPVAGGLFIIPCLIVWQFGVRLYRSTGS